MSRNMKVVFFLSATLFALGLSAQSNLSSSNADKRDTTVNAAAAPAKPPENSPDYVIGADDTLHISVWKEPDLSETLPVRPDGKISMPLLNDITAAGLTPLQLADSITTKLKKYIADPRVTVVVTAMNSQKIYILGEVLHPGTSLLQPNMSVLQALASAGFSQFA